MPGEDRPRNEEVPPWASPLLAAPVVLTLLTAPFVGCPLSPRLFLGSLLLFSGLAAAVLAPWEQARREASRERVRMLRQVSDTLAALRTQGAWVSRARENTKAARGQAGWLALPDLEKLTTLLQALTSLRQVFPEFFALLFAGWLIYLGLRALGYL